MSAGDLSLVQCFGFPPFIRVTGDYWAAGNYGGVAGSGVVGLKADINAPVSQWRRDGYYYGDEAGVPKEVGLQDPGYTFDFGAPVDLLNSFRLLGPAWRAVRYPVRQTGWTKGIYTHFVGDVIRRRTGPTAADCTYWRCKRRTDQVATVSGESHVGNDGRDPALPEMATWWEATVAPTPESNCVNTWLTNRDFTELPGTFVARDFKYVPGASLWYCFTEALDQSALTLATDAKQPWPAALFQNVFILDGAVNLPFPDWFRGLILARHTGSAWTHTGLPAQTGYNTFLTSSFNLTQIPKGFCVLDSSGQLYRAMENVLYPPSAGPASLSAFVAFDRARYSFQDYLLPTPYSNRVEIVGGRVTRRYFTRASRYARFTAQSQLRSYWPGEPAISTENATVTEEIRSGCNQAAWPTRPLEKITSLDQHPLAPPDVARVVRTGLAGQFREYLKYNQAGSAVLQKIEWLGQPTQFIHPGEHMEVETWIWDTASGYYHDRTIRYYAGLPNFYPLPGRQNFTAVAAMDLYWHPKYNRPPDAEPRWVYRNPSSLTGISPGSGSFSFDLVDDRQLAEAYQFIYPNRPGFTVVGGESPRAGSVLFLESTDAQQTLWFSQVMRWGIIRAHADADITREILLPIGPETPLPSPLFTFYPEANGYSSVGRSLPPMLLCRQRLNLYEQVSCG